jgi:hypothetical protein
MRYLGRALALSAVAALALGLPATAALAADATGCSGSVQSVMADGSPLDSASAPGAGGAENDPLVIDPAGSVEWQGSTSVAITSGSWAVAVGGVPVLSGTVDNADGATSSSGVVELSSTLAPVQWVLVTNARIPVAGEMTGPEESCTGSGWIAGTGGGTTSSPVFYLGAGFIGLGLAMAITVVVATKAAGAAAAAAGGAS